MILGRAAEGQTRSAAYYLPISGGTLGREGETWNWWQHGHDVQRNRPSAMVEACVAAYAQTIAMCPGNHWRLGADGGRARVTNSALSRIMRRPNHYQSISDFLLGTTTSLFFEGNSYALALRNDRNEVEELHPCHARTSRPLVGADGSVFYHLEGNPLLERALGGPVIAPARDVLHLRLHCPEHPLIGVTPISAAALQAAAGSAALAQQVAFFRNQSRPSFVLTTDQVLTKEQTDDLRARWNDQAKGLAMGGTPILTAGLKPSPLGVSATDSGLIDLLKLSDQAIANVLRVPHVLVGLGQGPLSSTESLMGFWLASGLGFVLNHVEEGMGHLFGLRGQPDEYLELDTGALLRPNFKERIEGLSRSVLGGMHSPDEARNELELPTVPGGHGAEPRVQRQVIPLSAWNTPAPSGAAAPTEPDSDTPSPADSASTP